jgi:crossover junction endodeoxyribonuclease RuvC
MTILGIDPGLHRTGYAIIEEHSTKPVLISCGCITTNQKESLAMRLLEISNDLENIIKKYKPTAACVESLFFTTNAKTAIAVGQARGVIMLALARNKLFIKEMTPLQVKMSVTGYGKADKRQVQTMVMKILNLKKIPKPDDAADACAIAWAGSGKITF